MKPKIYIIHSEYVQHGMTFNRKTRYTTDRDKAHKIFEEVLQQMKEDNKDMINDKENYKINRLNRKNDRYFICYYKYQAGVSNFTVEMYNENLE